MTRSWVVDAACRNTDPDGFHPEGQGADLTPAKRLCNTVCPVTSECLEYAMAVEQPSFRFGVWGGMSPRQRDKLAQQRRRETAA